MTVALGLVVTVSAVTPAAAQQVATSTAPAPPHPHPHAGIGGGVSLGLVRARGLDDGWFGRIELEALPVLGRRGQVGGLFGFLSGLDTWHAGADWGVGLPLALTMGVRAPGVRAGLLMGFEAFFVDRVADDTGVGFYAPLGGLRVSVDVRGFTAGVDARVVRRWQLGADDHTQWQLGVALAYDVETNPTEPYR